MKNISNKEILQMIQERNLNFSNMVIQGFDFSKMNLEKADFSNAIIKDCDFTDAILREILFCNALLQRTSFIRANLFDSSFENAKFDNTTFSWAYLACSDFSNVDMTKINLSNVDLVSVTLPERIIKIGPLLSEYVVYFFESDFVQSYLLPPYKNKFSLKDFENAIEEHYEETKDEKWKSEYDSILSLFHSLKS